MKKFGFVLLYCFWFGLSEAQVNVVDNLEMELSRHTEPDSARVNVLNALSDHYQWHDFNRSFLYAEEALRIAESLSFQKGIATACFRQAQSYWSRGDSESAMKKALQAVSIAENEGLSNELAETYRIIAMCYRDQLEYDKGVTYIRKAEVLARQNKNWELLARVYNVAGVIDYSRGFRDSSLVYYNKSLRLTSEHPITRLHLSQVLSNKGEIYFAEAPDTALAYFTRALATAKETGNVPSEAGIMADIGRVYSAIGNYKEAEGLLIQSLKLSRQLGLKRVIRHAYNALADLKLRERKMPEAFKYMQAYYDVRDSLLNGSQTRQIVELETRFEKAKQEQKIALLEQEQRIQHLWKNVLLAGTVFLVLALAVIYRLQNLRSSKARQLLQTQQALNEKLKETDVFRSRFFANISHEFRTPLALILGPVEEQLRYDELTLGQRKTLGIIQRNATRLLDLVNQLLDLSKLEAGKMELTVRRGDFGTFLQLLTASFDSLAEHKQIEFNKNISGIEKPFGFDADKVEKIVTNILFNAFKFTPEGGRVTFLMCPAKVNNAILISVTDTGRGIPDDERDMIFSPFYQSKLLREESQQGTGLGLSLVKELVKLYGGTLGLTSEVNQGTCITVSLPVFDTVDIVEAPLPPTHQLVVTKSMRSAHEDIHSSDFLSIEEPETILIVEDNIELQSFIASGFKNQFKVLRAIDGDEGLILAIEQIPDVIISDVMMPGMNGLDFMDRIRQDERTCHIPILLLTAKADSESRMDGLRRGADEYLQKPFSMDELRVRVKNLREQRRRLGAKLKQELEQITERPPLSAVPSEPSLDEKFILKVKSIIEENIGNSLFSVELLAESMNLSRAQLFRKVKALINTSPSEFINDLRMERAAQLIRAKADNVAQIGYAVGFSEQSYFAKRFRKKYGVSPSEFAHS